MYLNEYKSSFMQDISNNAKINATDDCDYFINKVFDLLSSSPDMEDIKSLYFSKVNRNNKIMQMNGFMFDNFENSLSLAIVDFDSLSENFLNEYDVGILSKKMLNLLDEMINGQIEHYCDDSHDILKVRDLLKPHFQKSDDLLKIKLYIVTNKQFDSEIKEKSLENFNGIPVDLYVIDIEHIFNLEFGIKNEVVIVDIKNDYKKIGISGGINCIEVGAYKETEYKAYLGVVPAKLLAEIYLKYGSKILEGNIRAFLGSSGKGANFGMRKTIQEEPEKFFIYNNGIAMIANSIETESKYGNLEITKIVDLQIINGGQTTASIAHAKRNNEDLNNVFIPMKLTVLPKENNIKDDFLYDELVANIAKYANTQNPIKASDFFSNHPYHVKLENISKNLLHQAPESNFPTSWYYERSRKKYNLELFQLSGEERKNFEKKYPKKQVITKELLAKYMFTAWQKPHIVSKGTTAIICDFSQKISELYKIDENFVSQNYFKYCVACAILFEEVDASVNKAVWYQKGGYKLNIVPYTIAKLLSILPSNKTLDWLDIFDKQRLSNALLKDIESIAKITNDFIIDPKNNNNTIVTEFCKKEKAWIEFKKVQYDVSFALLSQLVYKDDLDFLIDIDCLTLDKTETICSMDKLHFATGRKPLNTYFPEYKKHTTTFKDMFVSIVNYIYKKNPNKINELLDNVDMQKILCKTRLKVFSLSKNDLRTPHKLEDSNIFIETNYGVVEFSKVLNALFDYCGVDKKLFTVELLVAI